MRLLVFFFFLSFLSLFSPPFFPFFFPFLSPTPSRKQDSNRRFGLLLFFFLSSLLWVLSLPLLLPLPLREGDGKKSRDQPHSFLFFSSFAICSLPFPSSLRRKIAGVSLLLPLLPISLLLFFCQGRELKIFFPSFFFSSLLFPFFYFLSSLGQLEEILPFPFILFHFLLSFSFPPSPVVRCFKGHRFFSLFSLFEVFLFFFFHLSMT